MKFVGKEELGAEYVEKEETEETSSFLVYHKVTDCFDACGCGWILCL